MTDDETSFHTTDDKKFVSGSNVYRHGRPGELDFSVESLNLDESWPDSERPSTVERALSIVSVFVSV